MNKNYFQWYLKSVLEYVQEIDKDECDDETLDNFLTSLKIDLSYLLEKLEE